MATKVNPYLLTLSLSDNICVNALFYATEETSRDRSERASNTLLKWASTIGVEPRFKMLLLTKIKASDVDLLLEYLKKDNSEFDSDAVSSFERLRLTKKGFMMFTTDKTDFDVMGLH